MATTEELFDKVTSPRDCSSTFEPVILPKVETSFTEDYFLVWPRRMTTRGIQGHLQEIYGVDVSPALTSKITDSVSEEVLFWQNCSCFKDLEFNII
ncbi:MAG: transposase [Desulfuromonadaceae bacterium]|nr:transposase [Desulfuromonadaceae bacterium]